MGRSIFSSEPNENVARTVHYHHPSKRVLVSKMKKPWMQGSNKFWLRNQDCWVRIAEFLSAKDLLVVSCACRDTLNSIENETIWSFQLDNSEFLFNKEVKEKLSQVVNPSSKHILKKLVRLRRAMAGIQSVENFLARLGTTFQNVEELLDIELDDNDTLIFGTSGKQQNIVEDIELKANILTMSPRKCCLVLYLTANLLSLLLDTVERNLHHKALHLTPVILKGDKHCSVGRVQIKPQYFPQLEGCVLQFMFKTESAYEFQDCSPTSILLKVQQ